MYFFVKYLDEIFNNKKNSEKKNLENKKKNLEVNLEKKEIKYNFLRNFLEMINDDLSKK